MSATRVSFVVASTLIFQVWGWDAGQRLDGMDRMGAMDARNSTLLHPRSCLIGKQKEIKSGAKNLPLGAIGVQ